METLGNEALGKIMKIVDDTKFLMEFEQRSFKTSRGRKSPRTSVLNILSDGGVGRYMVIHFYTALTLHPVEHHVHARILRDVVGYIVFLHV